MRWFTSVGFAGLTALVLLAPLGTLVGCAVPYSVGSTAATAPVRTVVPAGIVQIDKMTGNVAAVIDASTLLTPEEKSKLQGNQVLNGIAYNPETKTFFITGKEWPKMFEVEFVTAPPEN